MKKTLAVPRTGASPLLEKKYSPEVKALRLQMGITADTVAGVSEQLEIKLEWVFTETESANGVGGFLKDNPDNDFLKFIFKGTPFPPKPKMNCQESMLFCMILAGTLDIKAVRDAYNAELVNAVGSIQTFERLVNLQDGQFVEGASNIQVGQLVVFGSSRSDSGKRCYHVALCVKSGEDPELMSLWNIPHTDFTCIPLSTLLQKVKESQEDTGKITARRLQERTALTPAQAEGVIADLKSKNILNENNEFNQSENLESYLCPKGLNITPEDQTSIITKLTVAYQEHISEDANPFAAMSIESRDLVILAPPQSMPTPHTPLKDAFEALRELSKPDQRGKSSGMIKKITDKHQLPPESPLLEIIAHNVTSRSGHIIIPSSVTLNGVSFEGLDLHEVEFQGCTLTGCDFKGARLTQAQLGQLLNCPKPLSLRGAILDGLQMDGLDLSGVDLSHCSIKDVTFSNTKTAGANFTGIQLTDTQVSEILLSTKPSSIAGATINGVEFENLYNVDCRGTVFINCTYSPVGGQDLAGVSFASADTRGLQLHNAAGLDRDNALHFLMGSKGDLNQSSMTALLNTDPELLIVLLTLIPPPPEGAIDQRKALKEAILNAVDTHGEKILLVLNSFRIDDASNGEQTQADGVDDIWNALKADGQHGELTQAFLNNNFFDSVA